MSNKFFSPKLYSIVFITLFIFGLLSQTLVPNFDLKTIDKNYLWRKKLISGYNTFRYEIGDRLFSNSVIGKDGGFYFIGETSISDFQKTSLINVSKMKRFANFLNKINQQVSSYDGTLLVVIPPNKNTIYPQFMPDEIPILGELSSLDRLINYLNKNGGIQIIDLRPSFIEASLSSQIYYKTDTHWNCQGAFLAYDTIITYLQLTPQPISNFEIIDSEDTLLDVPNSLGINIKEPFQSINPRFNVEEYINNSLNLTIFHDSYYITCLNQYFESAFTDITSIPYSEVQERDYLRIIETEKPDIVIIEFVERYIEYFLSTTYD